MLKHYLRPRHEIIMGLLHLMDKEMLSDNRCWFGGGTAIVLKLGEYRESLDVDFLCADVEGYRALRNMAVGNGVAAFFPDSVTPLREMRTDQYGIRTALRYRGQVIKFEIVREARIALAGGLDDELDFPTLCVEDLFAEKLLANADRCQDRAVAYRDALDLGMLIGRYESIPEIALGKAAEAYGIDIHRKLEWVVARLWDESELRSAADSLRMEYSSAVASIDRLARELARLPDPE